MEEAQPQELLFQLIAKEAEETILEVIIFVTFCKSKEEEKRYHSVTDNLKAKDGSASKNP